MLHVHPLLQHTVTMVTIAGSMTVAAPLRVPAAVGRLRAVDRQQVAGLVALLAVVAWAVLVASYSPAALWGIVGANTVSVAFVLTGLALSRDEQRRANAWPCYWAGVLFAAEATVRMAFNYAGSESLPPSARWIFHVVTGWGFFPIALLLLRYPNPRIARRSERRLLIVVGIWLASMSATWVQISQYPDPESMPVLLAVAGAVMVLTLPVLLLVLTGFVVRRVVKSRGLDRRERAPLAISAAAMPIAVTAPLWTNFALPDVAYTAIELVPFLAVPCSFLVAAVLHRLSAARVSGLVIDLARSEQDVQGALRRALVDDSLEVLYPSLDDASPLDASGTRRNLSGNDTRTVVPVQGASGEPIALVVADQSLAGHRDLLAAAVSAAALAMANENLRATVRAQLQEIRATRARSVEAALHERRQVERDLHDGAQQRLLALSMSLSAAQRVSTDPVTRELAEQARAELRLALHELRDLARGIYPAVLSHSGLGPAVEALAERAPSSVVLDIPARRFTPAVEATAYFVISEALANVAKYAPSATTSVVVHHKEEALKISVTDDGPGGANPAGGSGLAGLHDRVAALGGIFHVESATGQGTVVRAEIPCE